MNTERKMKSSDEAQIHKILQLCNLFLIDLNFS